MYLIVDNSALSSRVLRRLSFMHYTWKDCCSRAYFSAGRDSMVFHLSRQSRTCNTCERYRPPRSPRAR